MGFECPSYVLDYVNVYEGKKLAPASNQMASI
jgi:hypothetical protein